MQFAMLPLQGLGQGAQPIISYNYGAGSSKRVKDAFKLLLKISFWICASSLGAGNASSGVFVRMFNSDPVLITLRRQRFVFILRRYL